MTETLKALDAGATKAEKKQGWSSSSYGTRFVSAIKINKKAYVKYTMPKGKKFPDKSAPQAFYFAVSDTVLQFRNEIEEIEVCLDGVSNFYAENQDQAVCDDLSQID